MKFCKTLGQEAKNLPGYLRVFINYKLLKKTIKKSAATDSKEGATKQDKAVLEILKTDVERLNNFFIGQEEDAVIRIEDLAEQLRQLQHNDASHEPAASKQKLLEIKQQLVHFHGQMVMLDHWSSLNYNGLAKILKKHDKLTRGSLKAVYMGLLKKQAFIQTERINEFAHRAADLAQAAAAAATSLAATAASAQPPDTELQGPDMTRLVVRALNTWTNLANSASTPSTIMVAPTASSRAPLNPQDMQSCNIASSSSSHGPRGRLLAPAAAITKPQRPCSARAAHASRAGRAPRS